MSRVLAIADCFIDNRLRKAGEVFDYYGPPIPKSGGPIVRVDEEDPTATPPPPVEEQAQGDEIVDVASMFE